MRLLPLALLVGLDDIAIPAVLIASASGLASLATGLWSCFHTNPHETIEFKLSHGTSVTVPKAMTAEDISKKLHAIQVDLSAFEHGTPEFVHSAGHAQGEQV
jgi:hypothetical protein